MQSFRLSVITQPWTATATRAVLVFGAFAMQSHKLSAQYHGDFVGVRSGIGTITLMHNTTLLNDMIPIGEISYARNTSASDATWIKYTNTRYRVLALTVLNNKAFDSYKDTAGGVFGYFFGLTYSVMMECLHKPKQHLYFVPGFGLGYDTKTHYNNWRNAHIGTHLNFAINLELRHELKLNQRLLLNQSVRYYHYSNGAMVLPNKGLNYMCYLIGLQFLLNEKSH